VARALATDLPATRALLATGRISEQLAEKAVTLTSHLDPEQRRLVDKKVADAGLDQQGQREAGATVKRLACEADPAGFTARGRTARGDRRVTLRPAPDTMSVLSGLLPVEQGVACLAALRSHTDSVIATGDDRTRDQIMADTLGERVTGKAQAEDVDVEVGILLPLDALLDPDNTHTTGELVGHGPLPAGIARDLLASTHGKRWWRRLFTHPTTGTLVGGDPKRRFFDGFLAHLIDLRDHGRCRDPYCDAPIPYPRAPLTHDQHPQSPRRRSDQRQGEHADRGRGVCARGNFVREMPGWQIHTVHDGLGDQPHTVRTTTPTGHTYTSRAGP
jgi:hypothetical protein